MIPHHTFVGRPDAQVLCFVLHGVLGAGHNFRSFAKRLGEARPDMAFALMDLRYHGRSLGAGPPHTLAACAGDMVELAQSLGRFPAVVIGHSLGGKVALTYGQLALEVPGHAARPALRQVWALDSDPGPQTPSLEHEVLRVLGSLRAHPGPFASRSEATERLLAHGLSSGLVNWLVMSLDRTPGGDGSLTWRFDLDAIEALLEDYFSADLWPFLDGLGRADPSTTPLFELLVAEHSDRWSGTMRQRAAHLPQGGSVRVHELPNAGHWVHVDNPDGLLRILLAHLPAPA